MNKTIVGIVALVLALPLLASARGDRGDHRIPSLWSGSTWSGQTWTGHVWTGSTGTGNWDHDDDRDHPRPPMGSGAMMGSGMHTGSGDQMKGMILAIGQLSPADRATLTKMIRDYLVSKGVDPAKYANMRDEIHDTRMDMKDQIKDARNAMKSKIKQMRQNNHN